MCFVFLFFCSFVHRAAAERERQSERAKRASERNIEERQRGGERERDEQRHEDTQKRTETQKRKEAQRHGDVRDTHGEVLNEKSIGNDCFFPLFFVCVCVTERASERDSSSLQSGTVDSVCVRVGVCVCDFLSEATL